MFEIAKVLICSTAHCTKEKVESLGNIGLRGDYGVMVSVDMLRNDTDMRQILNIAREKECSYIMLDGDAPQMDGLPVYDW